MKSASTRTWTADNGNGTYSNPLFYDEFSDPDLIRVGEDYYLTGTTMHAMPGLPVLHSRDLVNWRLLSYAFDRLDLGPGFRLENGEEIYGQGIWAPSFRYHNGTFYIFSNINRQHTQLFRAQNPAGPWTRSELKQSFHDLSVLFDEDGKVYVIWGYGAIQMAQLNDDLSDMIPGSQRNIIPAEAGMGEGTHFYKIGGVYYITSAWFAGRMRMPCARADRPEGPYEVNPEISADEDFGLAEGARLVRQSETPPFEVRPPDPAQVGRMSLHQGGLVDTPGGEWWGFSMMDYNSVGRLTCLSPITWQEGWPYFGLPGNLKRTPRIWVKPNTGFVQPPAAPFERSDDFCGAQLKPLWQWNHLPDDRHWSLSERPGWLRLHALPAVDFWWARNTLTQRAVGPQSGATVVLDATSLLPGDVAGLALLNAPYAWIGVSCQAGGWLLEQFDQSAGATARLALAAGRVWLRVECNFLNEQAVFSYSTDGEGFTPVGGAFAMIFQLKTFQGIRYALFAYHTGAGGAGWADFSDFTVTEPHPRGLTRPIPTGQAISLATVAGNRVWVAQQGLVVAVPASHAAAAGATARFEVVDRGLGRVALRQGGGWVSVQAPGTVGQVTLREGEVGPAETFQWMETPYGDVVLLSLVTHCYLGAAAQGGAVSADHPGPAPDRDDGVCLRLV